MGDICTIIGSIAAAAVAIIGAWKGVKYINGRRTNGKEEKDEK